MYCRMYCRMYRHWARGISVKVGGCRGRAAVDKDSNRDRIEDSGVGIGKLMDGDAAGWRGLAAMRSRQAARRLAILCSAALLGACGDSQLAFVTEGDPGQSLSVIREQAYLAGPWQTTLIVAGTPRCQRRYPLPGKTTGQFAMDVHRPQPGVFILKADNNWYVTELQDCGFQAYKKPPPAPGELAGRFEVSDGELRYVPATAGRFATSGTSRSRAAGR